MELAGCHLVVCSLNVSLDGIRRLNVHEVDHVFRRTAPDGLRLPGSVHDGLNAAGIELIPNMNNTANQHRGRSALHRSVIGNHRDLRFFAGRSNR